MTHERLPDYVAGPHNQKLRRLRATSDIPLFSIKAGDIGGFVADGAYVLDKLRRAGPPPQRVRFTGWDLSGADLSNVLNLAWVEFKGVDLAGADLSGADFTATNFTNVDLSGARMKGAKLHAANLYSVDLSGADLTDADLDDADLRYANISGALFTGARFGEAEIDYPSLMDARGLDPGCSRHELPLWAWEEVLPKEPDVRRFTEAFLPHWEGTLREAATKAERLLPTDPEEKALLLTLLDDWEGDLEEALAAAETLRSA